MLILHLVLWPVLFGALSAAPPAATVSQKAAEVAKLRSELVKALEDNDGAQPDGHGPVVAPEWTQHGGKPLPGPAAKVVVDTASLNSAAALRQEIQLAVAQQGQAPEVAQLEAHLKEISSSSSKEPAKVGSARQEMLGAAAAATKENHEPNVVEANAVPGIDLEQLQRLELSKRRTRDMLVLGRIEELLDASLPAEVDHWFTLQANGSAFLVGQQPETLLVLSSEFNPLQIYALTSPVSALLALDRWNSKRHVQEGLLVMASSDQQLRWLRLEPELAGLAAFWDWPLGTGGGTVTKICAFSLEGGNFLALMANRTLSIYAYNLEAEEFWIAQRLQLAEEISDLAVLDAGREVLLVVGQFDEAFIYVCSPKGEQLQLRQRVVAPNVIGITAFHMGGRSYLALGGNRPQILVYVQGQLVPRTILGQNFGFVEQFLPVPVRSYRDDLLLLVQHRVEFDPHSLLVLEVLVWTGEAFEAGLPPPCSGGTYGASCLMDQERDGGIAGAALLRQLDQPPLVLVPRKQAPSGLFRLETQLLARNSESQDLQEIHQFMLDWVHEQDELIQLAEKLLSEEEEQEQHYEEVSTPLVVSEGGGIEELFINDIRWTGADAALDLLELLEQIRLLDEQLSQSSPKRAKRQPDALFNFHYEKLEVDVIKAGELIVEQLNQVPFYIQNSSLELPLGTLNVQHLELMEAPEEKFDPVEGAESHETLKLAGDLECSFINGMSWSVLLEDLVWRHRPLRLPQLTVDGPVIFEDSLHLNSLNELSFPGDFLWSQGNETSVVQAPKEFSNTLSVNAIDTSGTINGMNPLDAITLNDAQDWPGWVTFSHLEVSEQLELNGSAQGRQFDEAPLNPTLLESRLINADCHFDQILVRGSVRLSGKLDNDTFDSLLGDLVQRSADPGQEVLVAGAKRVDQLLLPVDAHVTDNALSGIPLDDFVTKHTPQTLRNLTQLGGYVYFHQLELAKAFAYDGVRLEELLADSLRLDGPVPLSSPHTRLRFVDSSPPEFEGLQVNHSLNQVPLASGYQQLHDALHLNKANFQRLAAERAQVNHDVTGSGLLNGQSLEDVLKAKPRTWSGEVHVQELILPQGVQADHLQAIRADFLLDFLQQLDELPLLILQGRLQVERIDVSDSIHVAETLNERDMNELQRQVVWLNRPNELRTRWILKEPPLIEGNLHILGSFNERLLPELLDDIVLRPKEGESQEHIIEGTKSFLAPIHAEHLQLAALNGIPFERLANKVNGQNLSGNVQLQGRLFVEDLRLQGSLNGNGEALRQLEKLLRWDPDHQDFVQRGEVSVPAKQLEKLTVQGHLGNNRSGEPLQRTFDQLIFKQQQLGIQLQDHKTFTGRVRIKDGAYISSLNDLDLDQLLRQLIFTDSEEEEVSVQTPVLFEAATRMDHLQAERLVLAGELLNGCNVSQWLRDTIRVDRDFQSPNITFSQGSLDGNSLTVEQLNQVDLSRVVTRHTEQHLAGNLTVEELLLDGQMLVGGSVNGRNLSAEYANTLMTNPPSREQHVETPLFLGSIDVIGPLDITSPVSGLNLSDVATLTAEPVRLESPLYFTRLEAPFLQTDQPVNGFDFRDWYERSLWARGRPQQEITGNWRVKKLLVKQAADEQRPRRQTAKESYRDLCERLSRILLPYQVQKLRHRFSMQQAEDQADVRRVFAVEAPGGFTYLLINERGCWTHIHRWNGTGFERSGAFQSGPVDEVTALMVGNTSAIPEFAFMTSYEMQEDEHEASWNCSGLKATLVGWQMTKERQAMEAMDVPLARLRALQEQLHSQRPLPPHPVYQEAIRYLKRPTIESQLGKDWQEQKQRQELEPAELARMRSRLLDTLVFRLQAEVNITQLSIPESDLFDEHLVEDFLQLLQQLRGLRRRLDIDTLPLPDTPARVLAARSAQLIWPVLQELKGLSQVNRTGEQELRLEQALLDVLSLANDGRSDGAGEDERLHAVIERLRGLQQELHQLEEQEEEEEAASDREEQFLPPPNLDWRSLQTLRLYVGPAHRPRLLYARLTLLTPAGAPPPTTPSTAPAAHIQVHHANGSIFQSLAAERGARHLTTLRVRDETLLAYVEGCCTIRVLIYRGVQGFVPFAKFTVPSEIGGAEVLQLLGMRVALKRAPGAVYYLAVVQARRVIFYELVVVGLLEPWLKCS
ncbi:uncharacterized protein LOC110179517 [Drosophila serrata]|uniref:uncharacterized protein LOC110179517 n=1 Tax=Drosophila serrata TaxID=7274 RepID=UPI000A1D28ED|nr:uncharacterized protein LOC110179517 [Drosophila serrata]